MTIEVSSTDRRDGKALALFARCQEWQTGHTKDGRSFFAIPGSEPGLLHMTDTRDCSCQDRQRNRNVCKHMRAVRLWMAAYQTGAVAPKPRPATTLDDERVALTAAGAEYLASLSTERNEPLASSWTLCQRSCGALVAPEEGAVCQECAAKASVTYRRLFGSDDDKPYCADCGRHHDVGAHYEYAAVTR